MLIALGVLAGITGAELFIWTPLFWRWHQWISRTFITIWVVSSLWLLWQYPTLVIVGFEAFTAYRLVNLGRLASDRMTDKYLYGVSWRTAWWLSVWQAIVLAGWGVAKLISLRPAVFWSLLLLCQLAAAVMLLATTLRHMRTTRPSKDAKPLASTALPSLTVAIPARNETDDLEACLQSLVDNDYPKLEIIVLDDCSQTRRTPEIIRGYAHDGVRFLAGTVSSDTWLAKNHAYDQLAEAANGELILFTGVDARFEPQSLRRLVEVMLYKKKSMISIIPRNVFPHHSRGLAMLVQPMRYAWEIALPRKMFKRPPVLSTCWIVQRKLLQTAGGFKAVSRSIVPESYFARVAVVHDGYSFMQSDALIGVTCNKNIEEQHDTATRTKYPQLHRKPELVVLLTLAELLCITLPTAFLIVSALMPNLWPVTILSGLTTVVLFIWYGCVVALTYRRFIPLSLIALPVAALHDIALLNYSMLKYEFSVVLWKDRNVCVPVMRVEAALPRTEAAPQHTP